MTFPAFPILLFSKQNIHELKTFYVIILSLERVKKERKKMFTGKPKKKIK